MEKFTHFQKGLQVRARGEKGFTFEGYAALFNVLSEKYWGYREQFAQGAFIESISNDDIRALFDHDAANVLGRNLANTLELSEDEKGLKVKIMAPQSTWVQDLANSVERGDINQMSFGFYPVKDEWNREDPENEIRTHTKVELLEVSIVTFPAYPETEINLRTKEFNDQKALAIKAQTAAIRQEENPGYLKRIFQNQIKLNQSRL